MTAKFEMKVTVVWADELRAAAKLIQEARDAASNEPVDEEKAQSLFTQAYAACEVALFGIKDDDGLIILGSEQLHCEALARRSAKSKPDRGEGMGG